MKVLIKSTDNTDQKTWFGFCPACSTLHKADKSELKNITNKHVWEDCPICGRSLSILFRPAQWEEVK